MLASTLLRVRAVARHKISASRIAVRTAQFHAFSIYRIPRALRARARSRVWVRWPEQMQAGKFVYRLSLLSARTSASARVPFHQTPSSTVDAPGFSSAVPQDTEVISPAKQFFVQARAAVLRQIFATQHQIQVGNPCNS